MTTLRVRLTDSPLVRRLADLVIARGDFVRPLTQRPSVLRLLGDQKLAVCLDNGCGRGLYTRDLLERAEQVYAVDLSPDHVRTLARRQHGRRLRACVASSEQLPFASASFDFILHTEVLEHIQDDHRAVGEMARVLKANGRLVLSVPVPPAPIDDPAHVRPGYTLAELSKLLAAHGLVVQRHVYCLFGPSRAMIRLAAWWTARLPLPPPSLIKLPLLTERWFTRAFSTTQPYDLVVEVRKRLSR